MKHERLPLNDLRLCWRVLSTDTERRNVFGKYFYCHARVLVHGPRQYLDLKNSNFVVKKGPELTL